MNAKTEKLKKEHETNDEKIAKSEQEIKQIDRQIQRELNKQAFISKKERDRRTNHLCVIGGTVEHFFPVTKDAGRDELWQLFEKLSELPEVQTFFQGVHLSPRERS